MVRVRSRRLLVLVSLGALGALAACSGSDGAASGTTSGVTSGATTGGSGGDDCVTGSWVSTSADAPSQAAIPAITPTGGGDGARLTFDAKGTFQIDFGPMQPVTATFTSGGQEGTLRTTLSGVEEGTWGAGDAGLVATTDDFTTAKGTAELILGDTVPPIFDEPFNLLNENRMLGGQQVGVWALTCAADTLTLASPFPGGTFTITAARA